MKKNYVLDTNILLLDSDAMDKFEENDVWIPIVVIDELDRLKNSRDSEVSFQAKRVNRRLRSFVETSDMRLPGGGTLHFISQCSNTSFPDYFEPNKPDHLILKTAAYVAENIEGTTILITKDNAMAIKAASIPGLSVEDYKNQQIKNVYKGRTEIFVEDSVIDGFYSSSAGVSLPNLKDKFYPNEFVVMHSKYNPSKSAIGVYKNNKVQRLNYEESPISGIKMMNVGQKFAKEALLAPIDQAPLTILAGPAGTAKTFLSVAAGLQMVEQGDVQQVLLLRPQAFFDSEIGYLPGDEQEKIQPLMRPFTDNLSRIYRQRGVRAEMIPEKIRELIEDEKIRTESFAYIRGRSISDSFIIIDEAQNASIQQIIGAITRAGDGSKIVISGDSEQVDNPHLDRYTNGLVFAMEAMKDSDLCYALEFSKEECRRSELAKDAISRLL